MLDHAAMASVLLREIGVFGVFPSLLSMENPFGAKITRAAEDKKLLVCGEVEYDAYNCKAKFQHAAIILDENRRGCSAVCIQLPILSMY